MVVNNKFGLPSSSRDIGWINTRRAVVLVCLLLMVGCTSSPPQIESLDYLAEKNKDTHEKNKDTHCLKK